MNWQKGSDRLEFLTAIAVIFVILFLVILPGKGRGPISRTSTSETQVKGLTNSKRLETYNNLKTGKELTPSPLTETVTIDDGNSRNAFQPSEEYIVIENESESQVNITGWRVRNTKANEALIPPGFSFIPISSQPTYQNIVLKEDERAIVTTGKISQTKPYPITSFKENICSGYLEVNENYYFKPSLDRNCPDPAEEAGVESLPIACQDFIDNMNSCETPDFETRDDDGEMCRNCADGVKLSPMCIKFLKDHYTYKGCILNHLNDPDFQGDTWRVFLGKTFEMWTDRRETIFLLDQFGRMVDALSY